MEELTLWVYCTSEKENAFLGAGISFDPNEDSVEKLGTEWIGETLSESFWENYRDFEPGIEKAKAMEKNSPEVPYREALKQIFGKFDVSYQLDDKKIELDIGLDYDNIIYDLIESC